MGYTIGPDGKKDYGEYLSGPDKPYIVIGRDLNNPFILAQTIDAQDSYAARGKFKRANPGFEILSVDEDTDQ